MSRGSEKVRLQQSFRFDRASYLIVLMSGTTDHQPYAPNQEGVNGVLLDLKATMAGRTVYAVAGFGALAFEDVTQGAALYARASDGKVWQMPLEQGMRQQLLVCTNREERRRGVRCLVVGILALSGLDAGEPMFLATSDGAITKTPPTTNGHFVVRVGEAATTANLAIQIEPPILLS